MVPNNSDRCQARRPKIDISHCTYGSGHNPPLQKADMNIAVFFTKPTEVLYSLKNTHPKKNTGTMGVCSIHCSGCECFNVDETARDIDTRFKEHKYACNRHSHMTGNRHILFTKKIARLNIGLLRLATLHLTQNNTKECIFCIDLLPCS